MFNGNILLYLLIALGTAQASLLLIWLVFVCVAHSRHATTLSIAHRAHGREYAQEQFRVLLKESRGYGAITNCIHYCIVWPYLLLPVWLFHCVLVFFYAVGYAVLYVPSRLWKHWKVIQQAKAHMREQGYPFERLSVEQATDGRLRAVAVVDEITDVRMRRDFERRMREQEGLDA